MRRPRASVRTTPTDAEPGASGHSLACTARSPHRGHWAAPHRETVAPLEIRARRPPGDPGVLRGTSPTATCRVGVFQDLADVAESSKVLPGTVCNRDPGGFQRLLQAIEVRPVRIPAHAPRDRGTPDTPRLIRQVPALAKVYLVFAQREVVPDRLLVVLTQFREFSVATVARLAQRDTESVGDLPVPLD